MAATASIISASYKPFTASSLPPPTPKLKPHSRIPLPKLPNLPQILKSQSLLPSLLAVTLATPPPSLAEEIEKASLFDFNLTLPIIAAQFLLLMIGLDKLYFTPLGKFMDDRDAAIRANLTGVKDTSAEVKQLEEQAAAVMRAARAEISAALNKMKKETQGEVEEKLAEGRRKIEKELQEALANLESQKVETIRALDSQIKALGEEIVKKVLPAASSS